MNAPDDGAKTRDDGSSCGDAAVRRVLDALDAGVLTVAADGRVVEANAFASEALRRPREAIVGRSLAEVLAPLSEVLRRATAGGGARSEFEVLRGDDTEATLGCTVRTLRGDGDATAVVLFEDVSALRELRRQRDLLLQLAVVGEVLPAMLHELRSPIAAVTSMLEVMVEEHEGSTQADLHAVLWEMRRIGLGLEGIGGVGRPLRSDAFEAADEAVREVCRILFSLAARKDVELTADVAAMPLLPLGRSTVKGVVFNLVKNAIDACRAGEQVTVRAFLEGSGERFTLVVEDTGKGMAPEVLAACRTLFFTTKDNGSGIGLAICTRAIEEAGGTLDIESAPGRGTSITVRVPLVPPTKRG